MIALRFAIYKTKRTRSTFIPRNQLRHPRAAARNHTLRPQPEKKSTHEVKRYTFGRVETADEQNNIVARGLQ